MSKKAKMTEEPVTTKAFDDSDDDDTNTKRERSPSPSRRKNPATPSQEANHAAAKKPNAAEMAKDLMRRQAADRANKGRAPVKVISGATYGEASLKALTIGYQPHSEGSKMNVCTVPLSVEPNASFDMIGTKNPYFSAMLVTHRPKNADASSRKSVTRKDGTTYSAAYPKVVTYVPNGEMIANQQEAIQCNGQIGCVSTGKLQKMNRFTLTAFKETGSGRSSVPVQLPVGSVVNFTSISGEDTTVSGYVPRKGNSQKNIPPESDAECANRVEMERTRDMTDRKFALQFKGVEANKITPIVAEGSKYTVPDLVQYLYTHAEFQANITIGLMAAHAGWTLSAFDEQAFAEEDLETKKLEYDGVEAAVKILHAKRKDEMGKMAAQLKRNVQEWQQGDSLQYHQSEPGTEEKVKIATQIAKDLELAAAGGDSRIKPWDMPYDTARHAITLVFNTQDKEYGKHTHKLIAGEETPKMFTDFCIRAVVPKSNGFGYLFHVHTTTVPDRDLALKEFAKGSTGGVLDSTAWYAPNPDYPPLVISGNDGLLSVAWKVQSIKHLPIAANMMASPHGNGIVTTLFTPRPPMCDGVDEKCYIDMMVPDVIAKLQAVGLKVSPEWLKEHLCDVEVDDDDETKKTYTIYPTIDRGNVVDVSKASAFANATSTLLDDTYVNLHELPGDSIEFDKIVSGNKDLKKFVKDHNLSLEYRVLVPLDEEGDLLDLTEGLIKGQLDHMGDFGMLSTADAEALLEKASKHTRDDENDKPLTANEFLKRHTIPYAILVNEHGKTI